MLKHNLKHILGLRSAVLASAALALAACTSKEEVREVAAPEAVTFDAYLNRGVQTRAGAEGELTTDGTGSTQSLQTLGFGVFGYYTNDVLYSQAFVPNFMYNEPVTYASSKWTYGIPKYWPNEYGTGANSSAVDRVSFFAYAPYVYVEPATGLPSTGLDNGITKITRATDTGDPKVSYKASFSPEHCVDLCWGVVAADAVSTGGQMNASDGTNTFTAGMPFLDVAKMPAGKKISYDFKHALAALNVQIDATVDAAAPGTAVNASTRIYVRQVTFQGFTMEGTLNLNNRSAGEPNWVNYDANGAVSTAAVTVYDQRCDGREAITAADAELPGGLNPVIVQSGGLTSQPGVTHTPVNLFNPGSGDAGIPIYVVPNKDRLKVTIVYDVETVDPDILSTVLADGSTHGSVIENVITKTISLGTTDYMEAGKKYTLKLHLGMNSVKFDAEVTGWGTGSNSTVDLPSNTAS